MTVLSMVQHRDVNSYLLAIKSFLRFLPAGRVVVVADPSLTELDRSILRHQIMGIELRDADEFRKPGIPVGGTWERLCAISEYVADSYVIQLDADTVAVAPMHDVARAVAEGTPFTLGTQDEQKVQSCAEIAAWARARGESGGHVQILAESLLDQIEGCGELRYIRGCSGFAGFPRNSFDFARLSDLSQRMQKLLGDRWSEWGTEQFTSNLLLASMPGFRPLPHPAYCAPHYRTEQTVFMHFIGFVRFSTLLYATLAHQVIRKLRAGGDGTSASS